MAANPDAQTLGVELTEAWNNDPANADSVGNGAAEIRATRKALASVMSQEHVARGATRGHHVEGSARVYVRRENGSYGDGGTVEEEVGRARFDPDAARLDIYNGTAWQGVGAVYPGLISMSAVIPVPATDGWVLCDGSILDTVEEGGIYARLVERLNPDGTNARVPDLRNMFVRGVDASGTRAPSFGNDQTEAATYDHQDNAVKDHKHSIAHDHPVVEAADASGAVWDAGDQTAFSNGVLTVNNPGNDEVGGTNLLNQVGGSDDITVDLKHKHAVDIPAWTDADGRSGGAVGTDGSALADVSETRPDNVALYFVMKL